MLQLIPRYPLQEQYQYPVLQNRYLLQQQLHVNFHLKQFVIDLDNAGTMTAINNTFILNDKTETDFINADSGSELTIAGNHFIFSNHASHTALKGVSCTINWGDNTFSGVSTGIDTSSVTATTLSKFGD